MAKKRRSKTTAKTNQQSYEYSYNFDNNGFGLPTFGYNILDHNKTKTKDKNIAFHIDNRDNIVVSGAYDRLSYINTDLSLMQDDASIIYEYRRLSLDETVSFALTEIKNASFTNNEPNEKVVDLLWLENHNRDYQLPKSLKDRVQDAFYHVYDKLKFTNTCRDLFLDWYIDTRIVYHKIIDVDNIHDGIQALVKIEPTQITKILTYPKPNEITGEYDLSDVSEVYVYHHINLHDYNFGNGIARNAGTFSNNSGKYGSYGGTYMLINPELITYVDSGLYDRNTKRNIGYMQELISPYNKYAMMEDSMVIFRITRAPSRLVIYVDTINKNSQATKETLERVKNEMRSNIRYDSLDNRVSSRSDIMSLTENYFFSRNHEGKTTEITQLEGGSFDGILEETNYFLDKLKRASHVPLGRWNDGSDGGEWLFGRGTGHQLREESRFEDFVYDCKMKFTTGLFDDLIKTQLICEGVIDGDEEWDEIRTFFEYEFVESNLIVEYKQHELMGQRFSSAKDALEFVEMGLISERFVQRNILKLTDDEIEAMSSDQLEFIEDNKNVLMAKSELQADLFATENEDGVDSEEDAIVNAEYNDDGEEIPKDRSKKNKEDEIAEVEKDNVTNVSSKDINRGNKPVKK